ncbi:hypothetical protein [Geodermatophilus dictyosporus]|uniref:hypothetical protein n=1 Tax=Geodermatophilus dictyosporus TaxID=1523247 RepID=UPI000B89D47D|nr:hypothetical protein [Geodermatophilus dictyosporus]
MPVLSATAALPFNQPGRAAAGLRAQLRLLAIDRGLRPDWSTFTVTALDPTVDARGRAWFAWSAAVDCRADMTA